MVFLWIFLPVVFAGTMAVRKTKYQNIFLLIASFLFYAYGEPVYVLLLLFSVLMNYAFGLLIENKREDIPICRTVFIIAVVCNIALLGWFKYANFILNTIDHLLPFIKLPRASVSLPIGISFFTFQALSYIIDLYKGHYRAEKNPLALALYISFFPQLIAGPIVRYIDIAAMIRERSVGIEDVAIGFRRFITGLGKKVIIANVLAAPVEKIFASGAENITFATGWLVVILYGLQIYYDFSGYSDMAIGLGRMFGFKFKENFDYPYISTSIREYWRRWHISLSSWFREYVYIPLGGNRKGETRTMINLLIVFGLTGLWHGASWNFVGWGLFHGVFIVIERAGFSKVLDRFRAFGHFYTILVISVGWVFFCLSSFGESLTMLRNMLTPRIQPGAVYPAAAYLTPQVVISAVAGILGCGVIQEFIKRKGLTGAFERRFVSRLPECAALTLVLCYCIILLVSGMYNPFIYTRF